MVSNHDLKFIDFPLIWLVKHVQGDLLNGMFSEHCLQSEENLCSMNTVNIRSAQSAEFGTQASPSEDQLCTFEAIKFHDEIFITRLLPICSSLSVDSANIISCSIS